MRFVMETLIDELATRAKMDPITYRRKLLKPEAKKLRAVLDLLDEKSAAVARQFCLRVMRWASPAMNRFDTAVACAVEVSIENKRPRIHHATVAVHCGLAVNPLTIESQFQGGVGFGLTQLVGQGAITLKDGRVEQRNFDGYTPPYIADVPVNCRRAHCAEYRSADRLRRTSSSGDLTGRSQCVSEVDRETLSKSSAGEHLGFEPRSGDRSVAHARACQSEVSEPRAVSERISRTAAKFGSTGRYPRGSFLIRAALPEPVATARGSDTPS